MLDKLPHLPLQIILSHLNFQDRISLTKVPSLRDAILDYYKSEFTQKEMIRFAISDLMLNLVDDFYSFNHVFGQLLNSLGMIPFRTTTKYHQLHLEILNELLPREIEAIPIHKTFIHIDQKKEYILEHHDLDEIYDDIHIIGLGEKRHDELCNHVTKILDEEHIYNKQHMKDFIMRFTWKYNWTIELLESILDVIQNVYDLFEKNKRKEDRIKKRTCPSQISIFYENIQKRLNIIEYVFQIK
jgi:hypothetical protein